MPDTKLLERSIYLRLNIITPFVQYHRVPQPNHLDRSLYLPSSPHVSIQHLDVLALLPGPRRYRCSRSPHIHTTRLRANSRCLPPTSSGLDMSKQHQSYAKPAWPWGWWWNISNHALWIWTSNSTRLVHQCRTLDCSTQISLKYNGECSGLLYRIRLNCRLEYVDRCLICRYKSSRWKETSNFWAEIVCRRVQRFANATVSSMDNIVAIDASPMLSVIDWYMVRGDIGDYTCYQMDVMLISTAVAFQVWGVAYGNISSIEDYWYRCR